MKPNRTAAGKVVIYNVETGEAIERWPVDARGMLASGAFVEFPEQLKATVTRLDGAPLVPGEDGLIHGDPAVLSDAQRAAFGGPLLPAAAVVMPEVPRAPAPEGTLSPSETATVQPLAPTTASAAASGLEGDATALVPGLPQLTPLGAPAVYTHAADAAPSAPLAEPKRTRAVRGQG